jgi:DUF4097 and DUF4098 domain-containing protein YvlB
MSLKARIVTPETSGASLSAMSAETGRSGPSSRSERPEWAGLWVLLVLGLLLMLAAAFSAAESGGVTAQRTDHFQATLAPSSTVRIQNISGDILASPGKEFSATVTLTVTAPTQRRADEVLARTKIEQQQDGDEVSLETRWPDSRGSGLGRRHAESRCRDCRITAKYEVVLPPGANAVLHTVNGEIHVRDLDGELDLQSVNGDVLARGSRRSITAQSVNGKLDVAALALPLDASLELKTVNGAVVLTLPKDARFELSASTMNGTIASTFPLPALAETPQAEEVPRRKPDAEAAPHVPRHVTVRDHEDGDVEVDVQEIEKEIEDSMKEMKEVEVEVRDSMREAAHELRHIRILNPRREYSGSIGQGGASVRLSTLNGAITLLASGTRESDAKPLVSQRRSFVFTIPPVKVRVRKPIVPLPPVPPVPPLPPVPLVRPAPRPLMPSEGEDVVRGDISGDFLSTSGGGDYRIGHVSGKARILTHSGEIRVASTGSDADLKTYGGDVEIGSVGGDLNVRTLAGEIHAESVAGRAKVETSGGDIRIDRLTGSVEARTAGGDIVLPAVRGGVQADTGGGDVQITLVSREAGAGIWIRNSGGDVTLTLPADFRGEVDLSVSGCAGFDETLIHSDFPEVSLTRRSGSQHASGRLNGGGSKVVVRTTSGEIHLRKGPPASS